MALRLVTAPTERPVSLVEARAHLRVDHTDEDDLIAGLLDAAIAHLEGVDGVLGRALCTATYELVLDAFPYEDALRIPLPPLQSVASVRYYNAAGALTTLASATYLVDTVNQPGWVVLVDGASWPDTQPGANAVIIRFDAGHGAAAAVPAPIKAAIKLIVGHLYRNREATTVEALAATPLAVDALIAPYRIWTF